MARVKKRMLIVDGYNVLNAWQGKSMRGADSGTVAELRDKLTDWLADYAGYTDQKVICVFDAWMSDRSARSYDTSGNIEIVFTQKGETADHYIERLCDTYSRDVEMDRLEIRVASSDGLEQTVTFGRGAIRMSSRELIYEIDSVRRSGRVEPVNMHHSRSTVMDRLPSDIREKLEKLRREK